VVEAKAGGGSSTLSIYLSLVRVLRGKKGMVVCAYVEGDGKYARFFPRPLLLGKNGVEKRQDIGILSVFRTACAH